MADILKIGGRAAFWEEKDYTAQTAHGETTPETWALHKNELILNLALWAVIHKNHRRVAIHFGWLGFF
jgi:hypothetical protein